MSDGRQEYLADTIPSALVQLHGLITRFVIHDDSGDPAFHNWVRERFPDFTLVVTPGRSGFGGAIRSAWRWMNSNTDEPYVFHLEGDFTFNRPVYLEAMAGVLDRNPHLVQMALRRQPWNDQERAAGGIVEQHPAEYKDCSDERGNHWLEHRLFMTTNPCLYRRSLMNESWPPGAQSEGRFTHALREDGVPGVPGDEVRFGFWGKRGDAPWVHHIGHQRVGVGY